MLLGFFRLQWPESGPVVGGHDREESPEQSTGQRATNLAAKDAVRGPDLFPGDGGRKRPLCPPSLPDSLSRPALCPFQRPLLCLAWIIPAHPQACASTPEWSITKSFLSVQAGNGFHILANCVQVGRILEPAGASMCACVCACVPACARMTCPQAWL